MTFRKRRRAGTILDSLGAPSSRWYCTVKRPLAAAVIVPERHRSLLAMSREVVSGEWPRLSTYTFVFVNDGVLHTRREGRRGLLVYHSYPGMKESQPQRERRSRLSNSPVVVVLYPFSRVRLSHSIM